jgi:hypothetical protein
MKRYEPDLGQSFNGARAMYVADATAINRELPQMAKSMGKFLNYHPSKN